MDHPTALTYARGVIEEWYAGEITRREFRIKMDRIVALRKEGE